MLEVATPKELQELKSKALQINDVLKDLFLKAGLDLVDFKIEFGKNIKNDKISEKIRNGKSNIKKQK